MKVIVSFGEINVIVPCGDGDLTVSELTKRAASRFLKARKRENIDVVVHCLQTKEDHGIFDVDDLVADVCDDKDMLIAIYDEVPGNDQPKNADVDNNNITRVTNAQQPTTTTQEDDANIASALSDNDSGVAADSYNLSNPPSTHASLNSSSKPPRGMQRKNPAVKNASFRSSLSSNSPSSSPETSKRGLQPGFTRDSNRKSLSSNHPMLYSWIDQHDKYNNTSVPTVDAAAKLDAKDYADIEEIQLDQTMLKSVTIKPYTTVIGVEIGLIVHEVVEGSYVDRVGELQMADLITEINGISLQGRSNSDAKAIFDEAAASEYVKVKRKRSKMFLKDFLKLESKPLIQNADEVIKQSKEAPRVATKTIPPSEQKEAAIEAPSIDDQAADQQMTDNKIYFHVNLRKGKDGLGFSITSKDVLTSKSRAFFVKNILTRGAAVLDGRIKAGDELVKVNNVAVHDKSQAEVVKLLRSVEGMAILQLARPKGSGDDPTQQETAKVQDESTSSSSISHDQSYQADEILTLTIPLTSQGSAGLGISVKGKRGGLNEEDQGIYVKSVIKGGAAAKDGRILTNDQLLCINDTSLIGLSNNDAMTVLRMALETAAESGAIRIIIGRSQTTPEQRSFSPYSSGRKTSSSGAASPFRGKSPVLHGGSMVPSAHSSDGSSTLFDQDADKAFEERYLQKNKNQIVRNKSYFRAVSPMSGSNEAESDTHSTPRRDFSPPGRTVSVSSSELPAIQKSTPVYYTNNEREHEDIGLDRTDKPPLPSYEEALHRRDTGSSSGSGRRSRQGTHSSSGSTKNDTKNKYNILPDKMMTPPNLQKKLPPSERRYSELEDNDVTSLAIGSSIASLDSVAVGPNQIPFQRDAFGRSSMSERKGRAHIDATKSEFYNKLKKFKSMEELRALRSNDDEDILHDDDFGMGKRSESIDTIISRIDEDERRNFNRNSVYSASTPHDALQNNVPQAVHSIQHGNNRTFQPVKLRTVGKRKKSRPYSCVIEDARTRNSLLNDSFKSAVDQTMQQQKADKQKKKGLFKGFATLLRKKKGKDDRDRSHSPEYLDAPPHKLSLSDSSLNNFDLSHGRNIRPNSVHISNLTALNQDGQTLNLFKPDKLQKELVQAKINEIEQRKKKKSSLRSSFNSNDGRGNHHELPVKGHSSTPPLNSSPYHTWNPQNADMMREKSRQFFESAKQDGSSVRGSTRSAQLQRQSSLPPRNKKDSIRSDIYIDTTTSTHTTHSDANTTSPRNNFGYSSTRGSNSAPNSKPSTPVKKAIKAGFDSLPRRSKQQRDEDKRKENKETRPKREGRLNNVESRHRAAGTQLYSSISDLTRAGGSVSISHQAQI